MKKHIILIYIAILLIVFTSLSISADNNGICLNPRSGDFCKTSLSGADIEVPLTNCCPTSNDQLYSESQVVSDESPTIKSLIPNLPSDSACKVTGLGSKNFIHSKEYTVSTNICDADVSKSRGICCSCSTSPSVVNTATHKYSCEAYGNTWSGDTSKTCSDICSVTTPSTTTTTLPITSCNDASLDNEANKDNCLSANSKTCYWYPTESDKCSSTKCDASSYIESDRVCTLKPSSVVVCTGKSSSDCIKTNGCLWYDYTTETDVCTQINTCPSGFTQKEKVCTQNLPTQGTVTLPVIIPSQCKSTDLPSPSDFTIAAVRGKNQFKISWNPITKTSPLEFALKGFLVYRCDQPVGSTEDCSQDIIFNKNKKIVKALSSDSVGHIDTVDWDANKDIAKKPKYTYQISAVYGGIESFSDKIPNLPAPDKECENRVQNQEYCNLQKVPNKKYTCDNLNQMRELQDDKQCQSGQKCVFTLGNPASCTISGADCGTGGALNLYYPATTNPGTYLDSKNTIVDSCNSCASVQNCNAYKTEKACTEDKCFVGGTNCGWAGYGDQSLGLGVCINKQNPNCESCADALDKIFGSCTQEKIAAINSKTDGDNDCTIESGRGVSTKTQTTTNEIKAILPKTLMYGEGDITFTIFGDATLPIKFCIGSDCPVGCTINNNIRLRGINSEVSASGLSGSCSKKIIDGINTLRYKLGDGVIQEETFYVMKKPSRLIFERKDTITNSRTKLDITLKTDTGALIACIIPKTQAQKTADIVLFSVKSYSNTGLTIPTPPDIFPSAINPEKPTTCTQDAFSNQYTLTYQNLKGGSYHLSAKCKTPDGTVLPLEEDIYIDNEIRFISPGNGKVYTSADEIVFETDTPWDCKINNNGISAPEQTDTNKYRYTWQITPQITESKFYLYTVNCDTSAGVRLTGILNFVLDTQSPESWLATGPQKASDTVQYFKGQQFTITCKDKPDDGKTPAKEIGFGCQKIDYCETDCLDCDATQLCSQDIVNPALVKKEQKNIGDKVTFDASKQYCLKAYDKASPSNEQQKLTCGIINVRDAPSLKLSLNPAHVTLSGKKYLSPGLLQSGQTQFTATITLDPRDININQAVLYLKKEADTGFVQPKEGLPSTKKTCTRTDTNKCGVKLTFASSQKAINIEITKKGSNGYIIITDGTDGTLYFEDDIIDNKFLLLGIEGQDTLGNQVSLSPIAGTFYIDLTGPKIDKFEAQRGTVPNALSTITIDSNIYQLIGNSGEIYFNIQLPQDIDAKTITLYREISGQTASIATIEKTSTGYEITYSNHITGTQTQNREILFENIPATQITIPIHAGYFDAGINTIYAKATDIFKNSGSKSAEILVLKDIQAPVNLVKFNGKEHTKNPQLVVSPNNGKVNIEITLREPDGEQGSGIAESSIVLGCKLTDDSDCPSFKLNPIIKTPSTGKILSAKVTGEFMPNPNSRTDYTVTLTATDNAGNKYDPKDDDFTDGGRWALTVVIPPDIKSITTKSSSGSQNYIKAGEMAVIIATITWGVNDKTELYVSADEFYDNSDTKIGTTTKVNGIQYNWEIDLSKYLDNKYFFIIRSEDGLGNIITKASNPLIKDTKGITITSIIPQTANQILSPDTSNKIPLQFSLTEDGTTIKSGIDLESIQFEICEQNVLSICNICGIDTAGNPKTIKGIDCKTNGFGFVKGTVFGEIVSDIPYSGELSYILPALGEQTKTYSIRIISSDKAGNPSSIYQTSFIANNEYPAQPTVTINGDKGKETATNYFIIKSTEPQITIKPSLAQKLKIKKIWLEESSIKAYEDNQEKILLSTQQTEPQFKNLQNTKKYSLNIIASKEIGNPGLGIWSREKQFIYTLEIDLTPPKINSLTIKGASGNLNFVKTENVIIEADIQDADKVELFISRDNNLPNNPLTITPRVSGNKYTWTVFSTSIQSDGLIIPFIKVTDFAGNTISSDIVDEALIASRGMATSARGFLIKDTIPPNINILWPTEGANAGTIKNLLMHATITDSTPPVIASDVNTQDIASMCVKIYPKDSTFQDSDCLGIKKVSVPLDSKPTAAGNFRVEYTFSSLDTAVYKDGDYTLEFIVKDRAENINIGQGKRNFKIDSNIPSAPEVTFKANGDDAVDNKIATTIYINHFYDKDGNANKISLKIAEYNKLISITLDDRSITPIQPRGDIKQAVTQEYTLQTPLGQGTHTLKLDVVKSLDGTSNLQTQTYTYYMHVDTIAPTIEISKIKKIKSATELIELTQINNIYYTDTEKILIEGTITETLTQGDDVLLTNLPLISLNQIVGATAKPIVIQSNGAFSLEATLPALSSGNERDVTLPIIINDRAKNPASSSLSIKLDKKSPAITRISSTTHPLDKWVTENALLNIGTEFDSEISEFSFTINEMPSLSASDVETSGKIKGELPQANFNILKGNDGKTLTISSNTYKLPISDGESKTLYFHIRVKDLTGNWGASQQNIYAASYPLRIDRKNPTIKFRYPEKNDIIPSESPTFTIVIDETGSSGINQATLKVLVNGILVDSTVQSNTISFTSPVSLEKKSQTSLGGNTISLSLKDNANNDIKDGTQTGEIIWDFTVDPAVLKPLSVILADAEHTSGNLIEKSQYITFDLPAIRIIYGRKVDTISVKLDGTDILPQKYGLIKQNFPLGNNQFENVFAPKGIRLTETKHILTIEATESGTKETSTVEFSVDKTPPSLGVGVELLVDNRVISTEPYISPNTDKKQDSLTIKFTPNERVKYKIDITDGKLTQSFIGEAEANVLKTIIWNGKSSTDQLMADSEITITISDLAGNSLEPIKRKIHVDTILPEIKTFTLAKQGLPPEDKPVLKVGDKLTATFESSEKLASHTIQMGDTVLTTQPNSCSQPDPDVNAFTCTFDIPSIQNFEGEKYIQLNLTDLAGNLAWARKTIIVDASPPEIKNFGPRYHYGKNVVITAEIYDGNLDDSKTELKFNNQLVRHTKSGNKITYPIQELQDGTYPVSVTAYDKSGNSKTESWNLEVNKNFPPDPEIEITNADYVEGRYYTNRKESKLIISFNTPDAVIIPDSQIKVGNTNIPCTAITGQTNKFECSLTTVLTLITTEADLSIIISARKQQEGNPIVTYNPIIFTYDILKPQIEIIPLPAKITEPTAIIKFRYADKNIRDVTFKGDITPTAQANLKGKATLTDEPQIIEKEITFTQSDGVKLITLNATDRAGNSKSLDITVKLDTLPPSIEPNSIIVYGSNIALRFDNNIWRSKTPGTFTIKGRIPQTEDANIEIFIEGDETKKATITNKEFSIQTDVADEKNLNLIVKDKDTSQQSSVQVKILIDKKGPEVKIIQPKNLVTSQTENIQIILETDEGAKCSVSYDLPPQINQQLGAGTTLAKQFTHTISYLSKSQLELTYKCTDIFENPSETKLMLKVDTEKPSLTKIEFTNANEIEPKKFLIARPTITSIKVTSSEEVRCKYGTSPAENTMTKFPDYDNGEITKAYKTFSETEPIQLQTGQFDYYILCEDKSGLKADAYHAIVIRDAEYKIVISNIAPTGDTKDQQPIMALKTDSEAVCKIDKVYDGILGWFSNIFDPPKQMLSSNKKEHRYPDSKSSYGTNKLEQREYKFDILCADATASGRKEGTAQIKFNVDITHPRKPIISSPENNAILGGKTIELSGLVTEQGLKIEAYIEGIPDAKGTATSSATSFTIPNVELNKGTNKIYVKATDLAGNSNESDKIIVTSISDAPEPTITPSGTVKETDKVAISFNVISGVTVTLDSVTVTRKYQQVWGSTIEENVPITITQSNTQNTWIITKSNAQKFLDGEYSVEITARDNYRNIADKIKRTFTVNSKVPNIIITDPSDNPYRTNKEQIRIAGLAEDSENNITSVVIEYNGKTYPVVIGEDKHTVTIDTTLSIVKESDKVKINATNIIHGNIKNTGQTIFTIILDKEISGGEIIIE